MGPLGGSAGPAIFLIAHRPEDDPGIVQQVAPPVRAATVECQE
jgi:hypothetical protein